MRFRVGRVASSPRGVVCEVVNPHYCDVIGRSVHHDKANHPIEWEWVSVKARDRAVWPHGYYDLMFACGETDERGITLITNYGDSIGKAVIDEFYIASHVRKGQMHRHIGTIKTASFSQLDRLTKKGRG